MSHELLLWELEVLLAVCQMGLCGRHVHPHGAHLRWAFFELFADAVQ